MQDRGHLSSKYEKRLRVLKDQLLLMGFEAEQMIADSLQALLKRTPSLALDVMSRDDKLDVLEIEIDRLCYEIIALEKPVARDLRFVATALKIVKDLERIGDIAVNIAERVIELSHQPGLKRLSSLRRMADDAQKILRQSLDAFVNSDAALADEVIRKDKEIDCAFKQILHDLAILMREDNSQIDSCLKLIFVAKHLERVGDHSANIAKMVIFMVGGQDIRHPGHPRKPSETPA